MPAEPQEQPPAPEQEARDRRLGNVALLAGAVIVIGGGVWLVDALLAARKADDCIAAGRRSCAPLEMPSGR
jgi:hypothetical protein